MNVAEHTELKTTEPGAQAGTSSQEAAPALFELAPDRIEICLRLNSAAAGGGRYELIHRLRPPKFEDWREYERNLKSTVEASEQSPDALQFDTETMEAAVALYDSLYLEATGYCMAGEQGCASCEQIPVHHKEMIIRSLGDVSPAPPASEETTDAAEVALFSLDPEHVSVTLLAHARGAAYTGLVHVFNPPTAADRISYSRVTSQALYVRGSRTLKTLLPARLPGLVKLYDQLIRETRGYCAQGQELTERTAIVRHMDALHKKAAVQQLFEA
jgi:hypothetical protein